MSAGIAILGSARKNGNTSKVLEAVIGSAEVAVVDLFDHTIEHYDYRRPHVDGDFLSIAEAIIESPRIILATPVYWYSMSGRMKVFFDRLTDLTSVRKDLGRRLAGRSVSLVTSSTEPELPPGFEVPFQASCEYLDMHYRGGFHGWCKNAASPPKEVLAAARAFGSAFLDA
jgi:NADPH-dependent FMN reductase